MIEIIFKIFLFSLLNPRPKIFLPLDCFVFKTSINLFIVAKEPKNNNEKNINQKDTSISEIKPPPIILRVYKDDNISKSMKIIFF